MKRMQPLYFSTAGHPVDRFRAGRRFLRVGLPLLGVFLLTLLAGNLGAIAPEGVKDSLEKHLPKAWLTESRPSSVRCSDGHYSDGRCAGGMTSIGLPESCFVTLSQE